MARKIKPLKARDCDQLYALKSVSKHFLLGEKQGPAVAISELKALAVLQNSSKFICHCHYAFQSATHLYYVLDLAMGGDVRSLLQKSESSRGELGDGGGGLRLGLSELQSQFIISQVLLALDACHSYRVLHRNIRPESILIDSSGYVKLTDFSYAQILSEVDNCRVKADTHGMVGIHYI